MSSWGRHFLLAALVLSIGLVGSTFAVDYTWTGTGGDQFWVNTGNWSPTGFPGDYPAVPPPPPPFDNAIFAAAAAKTVDYNSADLEIDTLRFTAGGYSLIDGTATLPLVIHAVDQQATVTGTNTISLQLEKGVDPLLGTVAAGRLELTNSANVLDGSQWTVTGGATLFIDGDAASGAALTSSTITLNGSTLDLFDAPTLAVGLLAGSLPGNMNRTDPNPGNLDVGGATAGVDPLGPSMSEINTKPPWADNTTYVYTGEIQLTGGTIAFTEHIDDIAWLVIDGETVLDNSQWNVRTSGTIDRPAGWYDFELRMSNGGGGAGPPGLPGFGWDTTGGSAWVHPENSDPLTADVFRFWQGAAGVVDLDDDVVVTGANSTVNVPRGGTAVMNSVSLDAGLTLSKTGLGGIVFDQQNSPNSLAAGSVIDIQAGVVQIDGTAASDGLDSLGTVQLAGGNFVYNGVTQNNFANILTNPLTPGLQGQYWTSNVRGLPRQTAHFNTYTDILDLIYNQLGGLPAEQEALLTEPMDFPAGNGADGPGGVNFFGDIGITVGTQDGAEPHGDDQIAIWTGILHVDPTDAGRQLDVYTISDDGSGVMYFDGTSWQVLLDNNGYHGMRERSGTIASLVAGDYPIVAYVFEAQGGAGMYVEYDLDASGVRTLLDPDAVIGNASTITSATFGFAPDVTITPGTNFHATADGAVTLNGAIIKATFGTVTVDAGVTMSERGDMKELTFGDLTIGAAGTLDITGTHDALTFGNTTLGDNATADFGSSGSVGMGNLEIGPTVTIGSQGDITATGLTLTNPAAVTTITKTGQGDLIVGSPLAAPFAAGSVFDGSSDGGGLVGIHNGTNPFPDTVKGSAGVASSDVTDRTLPNTFELNGHLTAGSNGIGYAGPPGPTITLSGPVAFVGATSVAATDDYTLKFTGTVTGTGTINSTEGDVLFDVASDMTGFSGGFNSSGAAVVSDRALTVASVGVNGGSMVLKEDVTTSGGGNVLVPAFPNELQYGFYDNAANTELAAIDDGVLNGQNGGLFGLTPTSSQIWTGEVWQAGNMSDTYCQMWSGFFKAPETGTYTFYVSGDDYELLWIDTNQNGDFETGIDDVSRNVPGEEGWNTPHTETVALTAGQVYQWALAHNEGGGGDWVNFTITPPSGGAAQRINPSDPGQSGWWIRGVNAATSVLDGSLELRKSLATQTLYVGAGGSLTMTDPTGTLEADAIVLNGTAATLAPPVTAHGPISIGSGTNQFDQAVLAEGPLGISGGTNTFDSTVTVDQKIDIGGGATVFNGDVVVNSANVGALLERIWDDAPNPDDVEGMLASTNYVAEDPLFQNQLHFQNDGAVSNEVARINGSTAGFDNGNFAMLWTGTFVPDSTGDWRFGFGRVDDNATFFIDTAGDGLDNTDLLSQRGCCGGHTSPTVALTAGTEYEWALAMNDTGGGGHMRTAWFEGTTAGTGQINIFPGDASNQPGGHIYWPMLVANQTLISGGQTTVNANFTTASITMTGGEFNISATGQLINDGTTTVAPFTISGASIVTADSAIGGVGNEWAITLGSGVPLEGSVFNANVAGAGGTAVPVINLGGAFVANDPDAVPTGITLNIGGVFDMAAAGAGRARILNLDRQGFLGGYIHSRLDQTAGGTLAFPTISVAEFTGIGGDLTGAVYSGGGQNVTLVEDSVLATGANLPTRAEAGGAVLIQGLYDYTATYNIGDNSTDSIFKSAALGEWADYDYRVVGGNPPRAFTGTINDISTGGLAGIEVLTDRALALNGATFNTNSASGTTFRGTGPITIEAPLSTPGTGKVINIVGFYDPIDGSGQNTTGLEMAGLDSTDSVGAGQTLNLTYGIMRVGTPDAVNATGTANLKSLSSLDLLDALSDVSSGTYNIEAGSIVRINADTRLAGGATFVWDPDSIVLIDADMDLTTADPTADGVAKKGFEDRHKLVSSALGGQEIALSSSAYLATPRDGQTLGNNATIGPGVGLSENQTVVIGAPAGATLQMSDGGTVNLPGVNIQIGDDPANPYDLPATGDDLTLARTTLTGRVNIDRDTQQFRNMTVYGSVRLGNNNDFDIAPDPGAPGVMRTMTIKRGGYVDAAFDLNNIQSDIMQSDPALWPFPGGITVEQGGRLWFRYDRNAGDTVHHTIRYQGGDPLPVGSWNTLDRNTGSQFTADEDGGGGVVYFADFIAEEEAFIRVDRQNQNRDQLRLDLKMVETDPNGTNGVYMDRWGDAWSFRDIYGGASEAERKTLYVGHWNDWFYPRTWGTIGAGDTYVTYTQVSSGLDVMDGTVLGPNAILENRGNESGYRDGHLHIYAGQDGNSANYLSGGLIILGGNQDMSVRAQDSGAAGHPEISDVAGTVVNVIQSPVRIVNDGNDNNEDGSIDTNRNGGDQAFNGIVQIDRLELEPYARGRLRPENGFDMLANVHVMGTGSYASLDIEQSHGHTRQLLNSDGTPDALLTAVEVGNAHILSVTGDDPSNTLQFRSGNKRFSMEGQLGVDVLVTGNNNTRVRLHDPDPTDPAKGFDLNGHTLTLGQRDHRVYTDPGAGTIFKYGGNNLDVWWGHNNTPSAPNLQQWSTPAGDLEIVAAHNDGVQFFVDEGKTETDLTDPLNPVVTVTEAGVNEVPATVRVVSPNAWVSASVGLDYSGGAVPPIFTAADAGEVWVHELELGPGAGARLGWVYNGEAAVPEGANGGGAKIFLHNLDLGINGTLDVNANDDPAAVDFLDQELDSLVGGGTINDAHTILLTKGGTLSPGGTGATGKITVNTSATGSFETTPGDVGTGNGLTYVLESIWTGPNSTDADVDQGVDVNTGTLFVSDEWTLQLAGNEPPEPTDQITVYEYDTLGAFDPTKVTIDPGTTGWDVSAATVVDDLAGTIYVTGINTTVVNQLNLSWNDVDGNYGTAANWDLATAPTGLTTATIARNGRTATVGAANQSHRVDLQDGTVDVTTGTLGVATNLDVGAPAFLTVRSGGTLNAAVVNSQGTTDFQAGALGSIQQVNVSAGTANLGSSAMTLQQVNASGTGAVTTGPGVSLPGLKVTDTAGVTTDVGGLTITDTLNLVNPSPDPATTPTTNVKFVATSGDFKVYGSVDASAPDTLELGGPGTVVSIGGAWGEQKTGDGLGGGASLLSGDQIDVTASGNDIWNQWDSMYMLYKEFDASEPVDVTVRVTGFTGGNNGWRKAGIMIRDSLELTSRNAYVLQSAGTTEVGGQTRSNDGAGSGSSHFDNAAPTWLRIVGDPATGTFDYYYKENEGDPWSSAAAQRTTEPMTGTVYVGLAVTAHNSGQLTTGHFEGLSGLNDATVGTLTGEGTVEGQLTVTGGLTPGSSIGQIDIVGDLTLGAGALYPVELTGNDTDATTSNDLVAVTGTLDLSATGESMTLDWLPGADATSKFGGIYTVATAGTVNGAMDPADVGGGNIGDAYIVDVTYAGGVNVELYDLLDGDATLDGTVSLADLSVLGTNWLGSGKSWFEGDFTFDGSVSLADLSLLGGKWLQSVGGGGGGGMTLPAAAVPEPGTLALVLSGLFGLGVVTLVRRRRRTKNTAEMKGGSEVTTSDACGRVRRMATTLGVLAAVVALAASAHGEILVTGTNWEVSMSAPTPVGSGAENLVAVTLSVTNVTGNPAFNPNAFGWHMKDGTALIGIEGTLHQEWAFGGGLPTPSMKPPFPGGPVGTPVDSHFLTANFLSPPGGDPQEDMTPGTSTEPPTPGYVNGFGTFLKGDYTDPDISGQTWDFAYLVVPDGSLLDLDAVFAGGGEEERLTALDVVVGGGLPPENASKLLIPADLTPETRDEASGQSTKTHNLPLLAPGAVVRMDYAAAIENIHTADTATYTATTTAGATSDLEGVGLTLGPLGRVDGTLSLDLVAAGPIAESLTVSNTANPAGDANDVIQVLGNVDPGSAIIALIGDGAPYGGVGSTSDAGGGTVMELLDGANLNSAPETIEASWSPNVQPVVSDIVDLTGISGDLFALQMSYDPALLIAQYGGTEEEAEARAIQNGRLFLGWNDGGLWRHLGDTTGDNIPDSPAVAGPYDNDLTLGHWGYDTAANTVWAVTDHNSQFAAVPEPGSLLMLLAAGLALAFAWRRRK